MLLVDTAGVGLEVVSGLNTAGDWTILVKLSLHVALARDKVEVRGVVLLVVNGPAFVLAGLADRAWRPGAILAHVDWITAEILGIMGYVLLTGGVWNTLHVGKFIDAGWVSTLTRATSTAVYNNLSVESNWGWVLVTEHDVESIGQGGSSTLSPA